MSHAICNKHQGRDEYFDIGSNKKNALLLYLMIAFLFLIMDLLRDIKFVWKYNFTI